MFIAMNRSNAHKDAGKLGHPQFEGFDNVVERVATAEASI
jgi:hypothetical protein